MNFGVMKTASFCRNLPYLTSPHTQCTPPSRWCSYPTKEISVAQVEGDSFRGELSLAVFAVCVLSGEFVMNDDV